EVVELSKKRDTLSADLDILTSYERDYRERLLNALEQDLEALRSRSEVAPGPRPAMSVVDLPVASERMIQRDDPGPPTREIDMRPLVDDATLPPPPLPVDPGPIVVGAAASPGPAPSNGVQAPSASLTAGPAATSMVAASAGEASANGNGAYAGAVATEERTLDLVSGEQEEAKAPET